jgi:type VI secretion system protein ImpC
MIEEAETGAPEKRAQRPDELQDFVRRVTQPHAVAAADPRQAEVIAVIDRAISAQMRALLHAPDFQAIEAAWRALFFLVRRVETNSQLKLYHRHLERRIGGRSRIIVRSPSHRGLPAAGRAISQDARCGAVDRDRR